MSNEIRKVTKVKAAMEDLLLGSGTTTQLRNGQFVEVTKINAKWVVGDIATLKLLDPAIFLDVSVLTMEGTLSYSFQSSNTEEPDDWFFVAPELGGGRWVLDIAIFGGLGQSALMKNNSSSLLNPGDLADAAQLEFTGIHEAAENPPTLFPNDIAPLSIWRCQGYAPANSITLFTRVK